MRTMWWLCANVRLHIISGVVILLAGAAIRGHAQTSGSASPSGAYFIAATPAQQDMPQRYPAALYVVGENHKLVLFRQLFSASQNLVDIVDDLHGKIYLTGGQRLVVIHEEAPQKEDVVPLENFDDFPCWGAIAGDHVPAVVQYCAGEEIKRVSGNQVPDQPRVGPGNWEMFKSIQYTGENGGPFQMMPPLAEIAGLDLVMPFASNPRVVLAHLPSELKSDPAKRRRVAEVMAATDTYLILWILPDYMMGHSVSTSNPDHAEPLQLFVLDRATEKWRKLEIPTAITSFTRPPIRIFDDWMVTTEMNWRTPRESAEAGSPGRENERVAPPNSIRPSIRTRYASQFTGLYIPGKLTIQNLRDGRKFVLNTGQEDSEVVAIRPDGAIFYRINDSIYVTRIAGNQLDAPTLIVKDENVPEIHWAFWDPAARTSHSDITPGRLH